MSGEGGCKAVLRAVASLAAPRSRMGPLAGFENHTQTVHNRSRACPRAMAVLASTGRLAPASCTLARCAGARQMSACARASAGCSGSARQLGGGRRAVPPPPAAAPAALRQHKARSSTRVHAAVQQQPQQPPEQQQQPVDRRGLLALLAAANVALAAPQQAAAAAAVKPPPTPLPVPPLTETFMSSEVGDA